MMSEGKVYLHPQGLRPGMRHDGRFKPQRVRPDGRTLASLAREWTEESVKVLVSVITGTMKDVKPSDRIRAAEIIVERGWGKAPQQVQMELNVQNVTNLTRDQLRAIASGALIEGEATVVTTAVPPARTDRPVEALECTF
jgi:hypothetical protein